MIKKKTVMIVIAIIAIPLIAVIASWFYTKPFDGEHTEYKCDVKNFRLATTIEINKNDKEFATVKGNIFKFVTDPLSMYDLDDNKVAYAGDAYHFIAQDSHSIYVNDQYSVEMVGLVDLFGESYKIYNNDKELVAEASFNFANTIGEIYDTDGNLIADYTSKLGFNDFNVRISTDCTLDHNTILMICSSYFSDQHADSQSSKNSN